MKGFLIVQIVLHLLHFHLSKSFNVFILIIRYVIGIERILFTRIFMITINFLFFINTLFCFWNFLLILVLFSLYALWNSRNMFHVLLMIIFCRVYSFLGEFIIYCVKNIRIVFFILITNQDLHKFVLLVQLLSNLSIFCFKISKL